MESSNSKAFIEHSMQNCKKGLMFFFILFFSVLSSYGQIAINGKVVDENKLPIIGASVSVKGTKTGTITDIDGAFKINVPQKKSIITVSFIGFASQEIIVGTKTSFDIVLKESGVMLNEVVAIGYASVKKGDLTGSVGKVEMKDLNKAPVLSFDQALGGRIAGVQVVSGDGQPGAEANIVIRGSNTISDNADGGPLYVIDGFPTTDPNASAYNPNDIESIDILKDASATAIYGARGANGVIIITTKRGSETPPTVSYNGYIASQSQPKMLEMMNPYQFVRLQADMYTQKDMEKNYFSEQPIVGPDGTITRRNLTLDDYKTKRAYNWQDEVFRVAPMMSHHIALNGGTKNTKYSSSLSYYDQKGIINNSSYSSLKARVTLDQKLSKNLLFGATVNYAKNKSVGSAPAQSGAGQSTQYFLYSVLAYRPTNISDDEDLINNTYDPTVDTGNDYRYNPIKTINNQYNQSYSSQLNLNTYLTWNITKNLEFKTTFSTSNRTDKTEVFNNSQTYLGDIKYKAEGVNGSMGYKEWNDWANDYTLTYKRSINKAHNFMGMIGSSVSKSEITYFGGQSISVPNENLGIWGIDAGIPKSISVSKVTNTMASYFARFNYDWKSRYLFTATMRADGSSKMYYNKWGYFPSVSGAWRISDEPIVRKLDLSWLSNMKLRLGWGATGNNNTYYAYPSHQLISGNQNYAFNNSLSTAIYIYQMANKNLKWESTYQSNLGLDLGILGNRITAEVDLYKKQTKDLLLYAETPPSIGFTEVQQNVGSIENSGLELTLNTVNLKGGKNKLKWTSSFNIAFNKNKVTALSNNQDSRIISFKTPLVSDLYICKVGQPLSEMYGYVFDGVYQYSDFDQVSKDNYILKNGVPNNTKERSSIKPGDIKLRDINGDGKVTPEDRTVIGHGLPIHVGGFSNNFEYKGFDLSIFLQWSYGNDVINYNRVLLEQVAKQNTNQLATADNRWSPENQTNYLWRAKGGLTNINTSREVEDASFLRLKTIQLGYNFPNSIVKKMNISKLRIYVSGQNLFTWTSYTGYDPEVSTRNSSMTRGFDYSAYPRTSTYTAGVNLTF